MFQGFSGATVDFMWGIRFNNEKGWFEAHKEEYLTTFQRPMKALADEVYVAFTDRHPDLDLICKVSRIYRDARRLFGRGPYKDHLWLSLTRPHEEGCAEPVFWFELGPEGYSFVLEGEDYKRPKAAPSRLLTPWYSKKSFALSHDAPHGEPLWSHDLVDLLLEGYEFLLPYYEYMLSLSGDPDPRAQ